MTTTVSAYAARSATEPLAKTDDHAPRRRAARTWPSISTFAGICHSDIHTVKGEWGQANYPLAPGHEIAGHRHRGRSAGDRIQGRRPCRASAVSSTPAGNAAAAWPVRRNYCKNGLTGTYNAIAAATVRSPRADTAARIVVDENYVLRIPELDTAGSRCGRCYCAGITLYSPLAPLECRTRKPELR